MRTRASLLGDGTPPEGGGPQAAGASRSAPGSELELYEEALQAAEAERTLALSALTDAVREREELSARLAELSRGALPPSDAASVALAAAQRRTTELEMTNTFLQRQLAAKAGEELPGAVQVRVHERSDPKLWGAYELFFFARKRVTTCCAAPP